MARALRRTHEDILDPQINEGNHLCSRDWNQDDLRATIFLEVPGLLPAEQQIPTQQMALTLERLEEKYPQADWTHIYIPTAQRKRLLEMEAVACLSRPQQQKQLATLMLLAENAQISKQKPQHSRMQ